MERRKIIKPNLFDPKIEKKINKKFTNNKNDNDYWLPVKKSANNIYENYIKPNYVLIIIVIIIIIFLIYRYRSVKHQREIDKLNFKKKPTENFRNNIVFGYNGENYDGYTENEQLNLILQQYQEDKEILKEPKRLIKDYNTAQKHNSMLDSSEKRDSKKKQITNTTNNKSNKIIVDNVYSKSHNDLKVPDTKSLKDKNIHHNGYAYPIYPIFPGTLSSSSNNKQ